MKKTIHIKTTIPGPRSKQYTRDMVQYECPQITYHDKDFPVFWDTAQGMRVTDVDQNTYLDLTAAFGVANCGHSNHRIIKAASNQFAKLSHGMGDVHPNYLKIELSAALRKIVPIPRAQTIFSSSGAEAVESALKTAMMVTGKPGIITFQSGYHGLTLGSLQATAWKIFREPFQSALAPLSVSIPYPSSYHWKNHVSDKEIIGITLERIRNIVQKKQAGKYPIGAIILEPIQGRGGARIQVKGFMSALARLINELGILMIMDEIYSGFGRTGQWFACEEENIRPDILCIGKGLANGFPISACLASTSIMSAWGPSKGEAIHTSTFIGNPIGCAMGLETIHEIQSKKLIPNALKMGDYFLTRLQELKTKYPMLIGDVRGKGLMLGVELVTPKNSKFTATQLSIQVVKSALKQGLIILASGENSNILCITPPLVIQKNDIDQSIDIIDSCLAALRIQ